MWSRWRSGACAPSWTIPTRSSCCTPCVESAMSSKIALSLCDVRRWTLTARLTLFFTVALAVIVLGVSGMMYAELVHQLHEKEELELKDDLRIQQDVFEYLARRQRPTQWQHEWSEHQEEYQRFAWQLVAPSGAVTLASANAGAF